MSKIKVLVVEDNLLAQKIAAKAFAALGCEVDTADDGHAALAKHADKVYDLIIMDIGLPDMDGHEVTMKIREKEKNTQCHTPIVALTAHAAEEQKAKALAAGMDGFFAKPLMPPLAKQILSQYVK